MFGGMVRDLEDCVIVGVIGHPFSREGNLEPAFFFLFKRTKSWELEFDSTG